MAIKSSTLSYKGYYQMVSDEDLKKATNIPICNRRQKNSEVQSILFEKTPQAELGQKTPGITSSCLWYLQVLLYPAGCTIGEKKKTKQSQFEVLYFAALSDKGKTF